MSIMKEFEGKNLDDAIKEACDYYGTPREKLEIEILNDAKSGIFGLVGMKKARVRAMRAEPLSITMVTEDEEASFGPGNTVEGSVQTAIAGQRPRGKHLPRTENTVDGSRPKGRKPGRDILSPLDTGLYYPSEELSSLPEDGREEQTDFLGVLDRESGERAAGARQPKDRQPRDRGRGDRQPRDRGLADSQPAENCGNERRSSERATAERRSGNGTAAPRLKGRSADAQAGFRNEEHSGRPERQDRPKRPDRPTRTESTAAEDLRDDLPELSLESCDAAQVTAIVTDVVRRLVQPIVGDVPCTVTVSKDRVRAIVDCGDDSGLLVGREGQTLAAVQYLASRVAGRLLGGSLRLQVDAGNYRERQDDRLRELALSLADKAKTTGRMQSTRPLSAYQRRIIHLALEEDDRVQTSSKGEGLQRRVVVQLCRQRAAGVEEAMPEDDEISTSSGTA